MMTHKVRAVEEMLRQTEEDADKEIEEVNDEEKDQEGGGEQSEG